MATEATTIRRNVKEQWLSDNPAHHKWLRQHASGTLTQWCKHEMAAEMVKDLKVIGLYKPSTVSLDICAAMRRAALSHEPRLV